jgi:hypothetical protein
MLLQFYANIFYGLSGCCCNSMQRSALMKFQEDPTCMALVMDGTAALGLDLSFVTRVFLMEPIWDRR